MPRRAVAGSRAGVHPPTGQFKGQAFTPAFGVATVYKGSNVIALGDGPIGTNPSVFVD